MEYIVQSSKTIKTGHVKQREAGYTGRVKRHLRQNLIAASKKFMFIVQIAKLK
jgi:hypothetical protein